MRAYHYVWETVAELARGTGTIQDRLSHAAQNLPTLGLPGSVPPHLVGEYESLMAELTSVDPEATDIIAYRGQGTIVATCMTMTDAQAIAVVERILNFKVSLDEIATRDRRAG
jgi:hypothetical protein